MSTFLGIVCVLCCFLMVKTEKEDAVKEVYGNILKECKEEHQLSTADLDASANNKMTDNVKCIFACALRKSGMMDDKGMFSADGIRKSTEKYLSNDPELMKKTEKFIDACKSVNDASVTDGEKGCDRALLIYQCTVEKAPNFELF